MLAAALVVALVLAAFLISSNGIVHTAGSQLGGGTAASANTPQKADNAKLSAEWGNVPERLVELGALNASFLNAMGLDTKQAGILDGSGDGGVVLDKGNATFDLYVLWALGMNNKNSIINNGTIMHFGGSPYGLASTGGYGPLGTLSLGGLSILNLTAAEQSVADAVAAGTYRPCCNNPAAFPDCNHGAAQLGLIELMASQGWNAAQIYDALKQFNALYYPEQYAELAAYFNYTQGKAWDDVPAEAAMGRNYSSASGAYAVHAYLADRNLLPGKGAGQGSSC